MKNSGTSTPKKQRESEDLLQGTLDLLILRTLLFGPMHGHAIATSIEKTSEDVLQIDHGSLYPALNRLILRGWISSAWGVSKNNRRAKFYRLTAAGRKQLNAETSKWERLVRAITRVVQSSPEES
jgi:PadR family transcriptional regulator, regulatory protein PadR